ncbi:peptidyl-tRNA hydrolase [Candidatus Woesearchaeota archaeon]|nr:MAG: peptidyl-tRNA hydrolase [Candidatus Woesearchaeota archaeon]
MSLKQVILVRQDLKLSKGKLAVQVAHASVGAALKSDKDVVRKWRAEGMKKSVLKVPDQSSLFDFKQRAQSAGLVSDLVSDAGRTHLEPGTITCLAIGPDDEDKIDQITGGLKLLS